MNHLHKTTHSIFPTNKDELFTANSLFRRVTETRVILIFLYSGHHYVDKELIQSICSIAHPKEGPFRYEHLLPFPILSCPPTADAQTQTSEVLDSAKKIGLRVVCVSGIFTIGNAGSNDFMEYGLLGRAIDDGIKAAFTLDPCKSWVNESAAHFLKAPLKDGVMQCGEDLFYPIADGSLGENPQGHV